MENFKQNNKNDKSMVRPKQNICVFRVSRHYLSFCPDPKHFIVNCEQNVVKFAEKWEKMNWKMQFLYKIFWQNKMLCRPTIPSFFRAETWNTHIFLFRLMTCKIANEQRNSHIKCCKYADGLVRSEHARARDFWTLRAAYSLVSYMPMPHCTVYV